MPPDRNTCPPGCPACGPDSPVTIRPFFAPDGFSVWRRDGALDTQIGTLPPLPQAERHRRALALRDEHDARDHASGVPHEYAPAEGDLPF